MDILNNMEKNDCSFFNVDSLIKDLYRKNAWWLVVWNKTNNSNKHFHFGRKKQTVGSSLYTFSSSKVARIKFSAIISPADLPGLRGQPQGYSWEFLVRVCHPVLQILTLFQTKKCHFPQPFSDLEVVTKLNITCSHKTKIMSSLLRFILKILLIKFHKFQAQYSYKIHS